MACSNNNNNNNLNIHIIIFITMFNNHHHHQPNSDHPNNNNNNNNNNINNNNNNKSTFNPPISPRISFSNDFADSLHSRQHTLRDYHAPPVSSDFEFSVSNNSMMTADELFFKGRLLPFKDNAVGSVVGQKTTLRDELLAGEDDEGAGVSLRPPKANSSARWKGFLGLRKSHIGSKRFDKSDGSKSGQDVAGHASKSSQEMMNEGGGSRDMEFRMQ